MEDYTKQIEKELRKDMYKNLRELRKNISEVRKLSKADYMIPTDAMDRMTNLNKKLKGKAIKYQSLKELHETNRQIKYIKGLKSSTTYGAIETAQKFQPIKEHLKTYSQDKRDEWWEIYGELYKHTATMDRFKYEIFDYIDKKFQSAQPSEDILGDIINAYKKSQFGDGNDIEKGIRFTAELQKLL